MPAPLSGLSPRILSPDSWEFITSTDYSQMKAYLGIGSTTTATFSTVTTSTGNSNQWSSAYVTVKNLSAGWNNISSVVAANSATWATGGADGTAARTIVYAFSSNWNNNYTLTNANSAKWNNTFTTLNANSAAWVSTNTAVYSNSGWWNAVYSTVQSNSAAWGIDTTSNLSTLAATSGSWNSNVTTVRANSATWNNTFNSVYALSASWSAGGNLSNYLALTGGVLSGALSVTGNLSTRSIVYSRELDFGSSERPSITGVKQYLNTLLYVAPALSYFRINGSSSVTLEVGQPLTTPAITWTSTKAEPQAITRYTLTLATGISTVGTNSYTFSAYTDTNTYSLSTIGGSSTQATSSWQVRILDWSNAEATGTVTASWRYRVYYGATTQATPSAAHILAGTDDSSLATSRLSLGVKTVSPNNEYIFVAYPQRFGTTSTLRVNGFSFTDMTQVSLSSFVNAYGGYDSYYVYRSNNLLTGSYTLEII